MIKNKQNKSKMIKMTEVTYKAFPTIPLIFVSGVRSPKSRIPIHDSAGMAVTSLNEDVRTETTVKFTEKANEIEFFLQGQKMNVSEELKKIVGEFKKHSKEYENKGVKIESYNYNIYSGSSDSGMAALVFALNDLFETNFTLEKLAEIAMIGTESAIRSVYGNTNLMLVEGYELPKGEIIEKAENLQDVKLYALPFDYKTRFSAREIFKIIQSNIQYPLRLAMIHYWKREIIEGLRSKDYHKAFYAVEENVRNAHFLFECSGHYMRRKEMMLACMYVNELRVKHSLPAYWTAGGGNLITVISFGKEAENVKEMLLQEGFNNLKEYKIATGPKKV